VHKTGGYQPTIRQRGWANWEPSREPQLRVIRNTKAYVALLVTLVTHSLTSICSLKQTAAGVGATGTGPMSAG